MLVHEAKRVLCFGDSNTWGYEAKTKKRFGPGERWTGVMQQALGEAYDVIEEGLNGRTTVWDDPIELHKNGAAHLPACLESHKPLDLVLIMLGTNDLKHRFCVSPFEIAQSLLILGRMVLGSETGRSASPKLLLISPVHVTDLKAQDLFEQFGADAPQRSQGLWRYIQQTASALGVPCFNAADVARPDEGEGLHIRKQDLPKLGRALALEVKRILE